jgi:hypothetical protein
LKAPSEHHLWRAVGDVVYVLDIRYGRYAGLSGLDAQRWVHKFGHSRTSRPSAERVGRSAPKQRVYSHHLLAWLINRRVRQVLGHKGFDAIYSMAEGSATICSRCPPELSTVPKALKAFLHAELLFRSKDPDRDCLVRSFSLFLYLRALGFQAGHRIGIVSDPFDAHAWVELGEEAVLERGISMERWKVISHLGP